MLKKLQTISVLILLMQTSAYAESHQKQKNPFIQPQNKQEQLLHNTQLITTQELPQYISSHPLNYTLAAELKENLSVFFSGKLSTDINSNSLLFLGNAQETSRLKNLLAQIDKPTQQVTLEAKIIAINQEHSKQLGINWQWDNIPKRDNYSSNDNSNNNSDKNLDGNFRFWHGYSFRFSSTLNALITNGKARILATPRIITIPGREASIFIGDHIPVQTEKNNSNGTYTSTEYVDAGIKLKYTPIISTHNKMVTVNVHTEVSTPTLISELKNYRITSRTADTNVRINSGETLVIGGLINEEEQKILQKIPLLSNIPLLGELFKNRTTKRNKVEVLMLLTPHITDAGTSPAIYNTNAIKTHPLQ